MTKSDFLLRHLSLRVPWHDHGWDGTVCQSPRLNGACLKLKNVALNKDEEREFAVAGRPVSELKPVDWPCCLDERGAFMAPFEFTKVKDHPYRESNPEFYGHFAPTPLRFPPYAAPAVPFRWTLRGNMEELAREQALDVDPDREPKLRFDTSWVQECGNQKALLDCFFRHIVPGQSLCFFYAKQVPFVEASGRVLIGVGRVKHVGASTEYKYSGPGPLRSMLWERMIQHSIRPDFRDGFVLPYHAAVERAEKDPDFDPSALAAFAPADRQIEFSYASELVTQDGAMSALLACAASLRVAQEERLPGPWETCLKWLDERFSEVTAIRGPCPGLGAALSAFGVEMGTFVAQEIAAKAGENQDPWPLVDKAFRNPKACLSPDCAAQFGKTLCEKWQRLPKERRSLLMLLSRFEITREQAKVLYVAEVRNEAGLECSDADILADPYLVYELLRLPVSLRGDDEWVYVPAVGVDTVDRGVFPDEVIRRKHPLPEPSALDAGTDARRVRALVVNTLEEAATEGSTLLPRDQVVLRIRRRSMRPVCEVDKDLLAVASETFGAVVHSTTLKDGSPAYQMGRLGRMSEVIRRSIEKRIKGKRLAVEADWRRLLNEHLRDASDKQDELEESARQEKTAALKELAQSRLSVLIGPAGTGKTTLLSVLCSHADIGNGGVLLLAPTGKARVRMEQAAKATELTGQTLAQFLVQTGRYDPMTGRYRLSERPAEAGARTVIVDEASMLTEEMLASLLDALRGVERLILIGDPRQLPPIGAGRPFVDLVARLTPDNVHQRFPRVGTGYAELTIRRRQAGQEREDLQFAEWFSGAPLGAGDDEVFDSVVKRGESAHVRFVRWDSPEEVRTRLLEVLVKELKLSGQKDIRGFDLLVGATETGGYRYFNRGCAERAEGWQILSPVKGLTHGVAELNRLIHTTFRDEMVRFAREKYLIPKPMGGEAIVYGDKVINVVNHRRNAVFPKGGARCYIANGEIGVAVGQFKTKNMKGRPWALKIAFSSQPQHQYDFTERDFGEEAEPVLELAYALTVHKAQGSEFGLVILVLPNPCRLLTRELLYTGLTRQRERVVILHQGDRADLKKYASDSRSETARRLTNLFQPPAPVEVGGKFYENSLIHRTRRGELVRSKSEVIIADRLADLSVEYLYERALTLKGMTKYPDFTIEDVESGKVFYWEHCGMMQLPDYRSRWQAKERWYRDNGILPHEEGGGPRGTLIVTRESEQGGISSQDIENLIKQVILG